ncbi:MAG: hypothetical protein GY754_27315 [bacterium]|nr:hypothetical protein [bacterium]
MNNNQRKNSNKKMMKRALTVLLAVSICVAGSYSADAKFEFSKRYFKEKFQELKTALKNARSKRKVPLHSFSFNYINDIYSEEEVEQAGVEKLFGDVFTSGLDERGEMNILTESKGLELASEAEIDPGQILCPFLSAKVGLSLEGSAQKAKVGVIERKDKNIKSKKPLPFAFYPMYGYKGSVKGGASFTVSASPIPESVTNLVNQFEVVTVEMEVSAGVSASAQGEYLNVKCDTPEHYNSIISANKKGKVLTKSLLDFIKSKKAKKVAKTAKNRIKIWKATGTAGAEAKAEATAKIDKVGGLSAAAGATVEGNLSYVLYDIETVDSNGTSRIQKTSFILKQIGAELSLEAEAAQEFALPAKSWSKGKEFTFLNAIEYKGPVTRRNKKGKADTFYVKGHSLSIAGWKKYFIDDVVKYKKKPTNSPYIKMLAKKFHASEKRMYAFINETAQLINESLVNEGVDPSAFLIEVAYKNGKADGSGLKNKHIKSMRIRYRLADDMSNSKRILKLGFNVGVAEAEVKLSKVENAGYVQVIDLYKKGKANTPVCSLLF